MCVVLLVFPDSPVYVEILILTISMSSSEYSFHAFNHGHARGLLLNE